MYSEHFTLIISDNSHDKSYRAEVLILDTHQDHGEIIVKNNKILKVGDGGMRYFFPPRLLQCAAKAEKRENRSKPC